MKQIWQGRMLELTTRYGEAPMATVCCNACRTCATTNLLALAAGLGVGVLAGAGRFVRRVAGRTA